MLMVFLSMGQTYSKILEPLNEKFNHLNDLVVNNESIYMSTYHCQIGSVVKYGCSSQSKWNLMGDLEINIMIDTLLSQGTNNVEVIGTNILFSGLWLDKLSTLNPIAIIEVDTQLNIINKQLTPSQDGVSFFNEGIVNIHGSKYLYGNAEDQSSNVLKKSHIFKFNEESNEFIEMSFVRAYGPPGFNDCHDLQGTHDGNMIYSNHYYDWVGAGGEVGVQIMKINTEGQKLDSIEFESESKSGLRLLASREGPVYCSTIDHPEPINSLPSHGRINKYSADLDTLLWSLELPFNNFKNSRRYTLFDYIQASNGDIMACGSVWDEGPGGPLEDPLDHTFNGFVVRVSQEGELKWIRIYRIPITHPLLPTDEYGRFRSSGLSKLKELDDGRFILGGNVQYNSLQWSVIEPAGETISHVWLLTVDEDGCIEDEECQEVIILDQEIAYTFEGNLVSPINQWNEVSYDIEGNAYNRRFTFTEDSTFTNGNWYYELLRSWDEAGNNWENTGQYFRKSGSKIFEILNADDYLIYDFSLIVGDTFTIAETQSSSERKLIVSKIDSLTLIDNSTRKRLYLRCENDPDGTLYGEKVWIEGIGDVHGLLSVDKSCTLDQNGKLLCFQEDGNVLYQDEIEGKCWILTSIDELEVYGIRIFPNPTNTIIKLNGQTGIFKYQLFALNGVLILSGESSGEININTLPSGFYLLELSIQDKKVVTRIIIE